MDWLALIPVRRMLLAFGVLTLAFVERKVLSNAKVVESFYSLPLLKRIPKKISRLVDIVEVDLFWGCLLSIPTILVGSPPATIIIVKLVLIKASCEIALLLQQSLGELVCRYAKNPEARQRLETLIPAITTITRWLTIGVAVIAACYAVGFDPSPLLASGLAVMVIIGFGSAEAIADIVSGLFILFEGHYHLGDRITIKGRGKSETGVVVDFSLKTTKLKTRTGDVVYFRNGRFDSFARAYGLGENNIFISYSRQDNIARAGESAGLIDLLVLNLRKSGHEPWVDFDTEDIPAGTHWEDQIIKAIEKAEIIIFVLSPTFLASAECAKEIACVRARRHDKKIFPIIAKPVDPATVPEFLAELDWVFFDEPSKFPGSFLDLMRGIAYASR